MSSFRRRGAALLVALLLLSVSPSARAAQVEDDPGSESEATLSGSTQTDESDGTTDVTITADTQIPPVAGATDVPPPPVQPGSDVVTVSGEPALPVEDDCVEVILEYDEEIGSTTHVGCRTRWVCGSERVDDWMTGEIAGQAPGVYAAFLQWMGGILAAGDATGEPGLDNITSVNDVLVDNGLAGEDSDDNMIPVFHYCAEQDVATGDIIEFDLLAISFTADLPAEDVYDIPGGLDGLFDQVKASLDLYNPEIGLVPKAEFATTLVQFPTWLYVPELVEHEAAAATNDVDTFWLAVRARLEVVEWRFGGQLMTPCLPGEMKGFDAEVHHVIDDLPECHHVFNDIGLSDLSVTLRYRIEQDVRTRGSAQAPWPEPQWEDFLDELTYVDKVSTIADFAVMPVYSVNIAIDTSPDQLDALIEQARLEIREQLASSTN